MNGNAATDPRPAMHHRHAFSQVSRGLHWPCLYDLLLLFLTRGRERRFRESIVDLAGIRPGEHMLDIGCGTGTLAIAAWRRSRPGGSVHGADVSAKMIAVARKKARKAELDAALHFQVADATVLPFRDQMFDAVTVTIVMHMVPEAERAAALQEASRVLRPGGRLLLVDYGGATRSGLMVYLRAHRAFELDSLRPLFPGAQLEETGRGPLGWPGLQYLLAAKVGAAG